jgi:2-amino-4-hydroxy-6-hydroxymethyldihydropteridine diphosphokinase
VTRPAPDAAGPPHPAVAAGHAVLSLGSNLGDRLGYLRAAADALGAFARSPVYQTDPVGGVDQDPFLNAVVLVPAAPPRELLAAARAAETAARRVRGVHWGPRTLDVDVIALGSTTSDDPEIIIPHPQAHLRAFVCVPWLDVEPDAVLPGHGRVAGIVAAMRASGAGAAATDLAGVRPTDLSLRADR